MEIKNSYIAADAQPGDSFSAGLSSSVAPTGKDVMVGFADDLMAVKARLCGESKKLRVIPIFGMGGIGKTTLARSAFEDPLCVEYFQICAWVTVSQDYDAEKIVSSLLTSIRACNAKGSGQSSEVREEKVYKSLKDIAQSNKLAEKDSEQSNNSREEEEVYKSLKGGRYLIVLDDMWSTEAWDDLKRIFPDDSNGSRIMLTTRLSDVAAYVDSRSPLHEMHLMGVNQSWNLLQKKVFHQDRCPLELVDIGVAIARSCRGLPLAIVTIAGILSTTSQTRASWINVEANVASTVTTNDEHFSNILSLSYTHLPHHLRPCFLYMGCFPEDHEVLVSKLIKLWVAEGFSEPSGTKSSEEVAEEYLEDLVKRSLVLVGTRKSNGKIRSCSLHDLMRDLCISKAQEERFLLHVTSRYVDKALLKDQHRISITHSNYIDWLRDFHGSHVIRTILCFAYSLSSIESLGSFRLLRVLDAEKVSFFYFPSEVLELFHLRYLALANIQNLPASISNLQNLQTLIIHHIADPRNVLLLSAILRLPLEIWKMPQLRHVVTSKHFNPLRDPPVGASTSVLANFQTLSIVRNFRCTKRIVERIPNIKKLGIWYDRLDYEIYHLNNLVLLHQLEELKLTIQAPFCYGRNLNLALPATLKKLTLSGCRIPWEDMSIVGSLPNLQVLKLRNYACDGDIWEMNEGEFCRLKYLLIIDSDLRYWITESSHFPKLECLLLHFCRRLSEIPEEIGEIPTLKLIELDGWNIPLVESARRIKEEQESFGNEGLQVRFKYRFP